MKHWYALRSKTKRETSAASLLSQAGIEVYLPHVNVRKQRGKPPVLEPFFPGYLFGRLDPEQGDIHLISYTSGILYVVGYGGEPCPMPDELILSLQDRLSRSEGRRPQVEFRSGDLVVITGGPFRDVEAIFDSRLSAAGRVRVLIQMLQRLCRVDVQVEQLRLVATSAPVIRA